jgi:hypothetical protein
MIKVVQYIITHFSYSVPQILTAYVIMWAKKYGRARHAMDGNITQSMPIAYWIT